ncbi:MAG: class I SAM-dependent methyltransferase [Bacteroidota bacterium]|nr:class I SAM-dependent methyltransferase [Bacteroidota bacterium]
MNCRFCKAPLEHVFIDLNNSPASNSFLTKDQLNEPETFYPLKVFTCTNCFLVQVDEYKKSDAIFNNEYVYFSSYSTSWLAHSKAYVKKMIERFRFDNNSLVIELASNDGYLLQYFKEQQIPVLGIEPTANTAEVAIQKSIETVVDFFGVKLANKLSEEGRKADLLLGNNVLAHVPDIVDFVKGMKILLKDSGIITMEFPHLMQLINNNQFDTIYHEHFSYLSLYTVKQIFESAGLVIFDVDEIPTHGGSLRIFASHKNNAEQGISENVQVVLEKELSHGIDKIEYYEGFQQKALKAKIDLLQFLIDQKNENKKVVAYGAAAKGNTLLNYCGIKNDLIEFVVDANPNKQNKFSPASHIPVVAESEIKKAKPDFILILPWNLKTEITNQLSYIKDWNGKFVLPIPALEIV